MDDDSDYFADYPGEQGGGGGPEPKWSRWLWNIVAVLIIIFNVLWILDGCPVPYR